MLVALSIRDIVLIDRADLDLEAGLCVLTGETGAGKSILLDALGLALGGRAEARLVRDGADKGSVSAVFELPADAAVQALLAEHELQDGSQLVLRRVLSADGRSRAFVNDQPVSVALLRRIGAGLVEVHGQHDGHGLLRAAMHRELLDRYGGLDDEVAACRERHAALRAAREALAATQAALSQAQVEEDYLRHVHGELVALDPQPGEEAELSQLRALMREGERIAQALQDADAALSGPDGADTRLRNAQRAVELAADKAQGRLDGLIEALDRAAAELMEAMEQLGAVGRELDSDPRRLDEIEERLFALREAARKHRTTVEALPALQADFERRLSALDGGAAELDGLERAVAAAGADYRQAAEALSVARRAAAGRLQAAVLAELPPLALDKAHFEVAVAALGEDDWGPEGMDQVGFLIVTNPGQAVDQLMRIASGGELSRIMLALKVALAETREVRSMIFDEVDQGVGGATASRVGERLARLADDAQVLVVTHSPQVAAHAARHWRIEKAEHDGRASTNVVALDGQSRREEIARMLAGAEVTAEARAAADSLLAAGQA